jgi:hypothetical protein
MEVDGTAAGMYHAIVNAVTLQHCNNLGIDMADGRGMMASR